MCTTVVKIATTILLWWPEQRSGVSKTIAGMTSWRFSITAKITRSSGWEYMLQRKPLWWWLFLHHRSTSAVPFFKLNAVFGETKIRGLYSCQSQTQDGVQVPKHDASQQALCGDTWSFVCNDKEANQTRSAPHYGRREEQIWFLDFARRLEQSIGFHRSCSNQAATFKNQLLRISVV